MPRNKGGGVLTETQKKRFQGRLAHYFRNYRYRNHLEQKDVAKKLGYESVTRYSTLESEKTPYPRFVTAIDFLASIAALEEMRLGEFVAYLEGKEHGEDPTCEGGKLTKIEQTILAAFAPLAISVRRDFLKVCQEVDTKGKKKFEMIIEIVNLLQSKDTKAIELLRDTIRAL